MITTFKSSLLFWILPFLLKPSAQSLVALSQPPRPYKTGTDLGSFCLHCQKTTLAVSWTAWKFLWISNILKCSKWYFDDDFNYWKYGMTDPSFITNPPLGHLLFLSANFPYPLEIFGKFNPSKKGRVQTKQWIEHSRKRFIPKKQSCVVSMQVCDGEENIPKFVKKMSGSSFPKNKAW